MTGKYLISTDSWFFAPDGRQYNAVWGEVKISEDTFLGIKTNRNSSNWFAIVGPDHNHVVIAGCQIHYAVKCNSRPKFKNVADFRVTDNGLKEFIRPSQIYIAI